MASLRNRSSEIEIMDDLDCQGEVVDQTLRELDFINQWLGGNAVTLHALNKVLKNHSKNQEITIADLGCGSGEMLRLITKKMSQENRVLKLLGIDANPNIIEFAKTHSLKFDNISFEAVNIFSKEFRDRKFDIVLCTLFLHHFTEEQLVAIFKSLHQQTTIGIIVNDIHRHPLAYYSIKWLTQIFSKSAMVKFDAPLSVQRAFTKNELKDILSKAGITNYQLKWKWAFRWQLIVQSKL
ncbi:MAG: methyltransferase domain-containing protein [Cyclobacteriaceae bacterium]|jgi:2-polyprenyl-3-methyl-5-hydroxy-6-metoxy-1,4-benzoquinol methylase|nr:methyltransferase domain-containing protein [Flammeovirgaceae bacterium]